MPALNLNLPIRPILKVVTRIPFGHNGRARSDLPAKSNAWEALRPKCCPGSVHPNRAPRAIYPLVDRNGVGTPHRIDKQHKIKLKGTRNAAGKGKCDDRQETVRDCASRRPDRISSTLEGLGRFQAPYLESVAIAGSSGFGGSFSLAPDKISPNIAGSAMHCQIRALPIRTEGGRRRR